MLIGTLPGCGPAVSREVKVEGASAPIDPLVVIDECEDRRVVTEELLDLVDHPDSEVRGRLAEVLGRVGGADGMGALMTLVGDRDDDVARSALFGLGIAGKGDPKAIEIVRGLPDDRDGIEVALGELGETEDARRLLTIAREDRTARAGAVRALGVMGTRGVELDGGAAREISEYLGDDDPSVRFMAAFALYRVAGSERDPADIVKSLRAALGDPEPDVRAYALRAIARRGGMDQAIFLAAVQDDDDRVSSGAFTALPFVPEKDRCSMALAALEYLISGDDGQTRRLLGTGVHGVRAALEAAIDCDPEAVSVPAAKIVDLTGEIGMRPLPAGVAMVRCMGRLMSGDGDMAVVACDGSRPYVGKRLLAHRLARRATDSDVGVLMGMADDPDLRVAAAALDALASVPRPDARRKVLDAIEGGGVLLCAAAMDAIVANREVFLDDSGDEGMEKQILASLSEAVERFVSLDHGTAALVSAASVVAALGKDPGAVVLGRLVADSRPPVRWAALEAYGSVEGIDPPANLAPLEPVRPFSSKRRSEWRVASVVARVRTTQGEFSIRLRPDVAPATVDSFVTLARDGYFTRTEIHRVVPNFVVQAGDPTGTGLGDPGYNLRCEISALPFERGTVGMALAGKDTGGSQFFVATSPQPHLDGRYTVFGKVVAGMEVVDAIEEGDSILAVYVDMETGKDASDR